MLFYILVNNLAARIVIYTALSLIAAVWYYKYIFKPYARFSSARLEHLIPYWTLIRRPLNIVILQKLNEYCKRYEAEGMFVLWIFKPLLVVYDEEIVKHIVQDPSTTCRPFHYKLMEFSMGNGILTSNGENWKRRVKTISPAFHVKALKAYVSVINRNAKDLVQNLFEKKSGHKDDISYVLGLCTLRLLYESSLGVGEGDTKEELKTIKRIQKVYEFIVYRILTPWLYSDFCFHLIPYAKKVLRADKKLKRTCRKILEDIKETVSNRNQSLVKIEEDDELCTKPKSFGEIIIEDHLKMPDVSMQDLADEISFLIAAGFDTSAHTLMWCFFSLGHHQDIQQRLYDEILAVTNDNVDYNDVQDLIYLDCVIKETLRFYSVVPIFARRLNEDLNCGNHFIPKNTNVAVLTLALHKNPRIYPEPEKFNPDRFLDADSKIRPWNFLPFAEGNRPCLGKKFALLSIKIVMIHVLRNFKIVSLDRMEDLNLKWAVVSTCEKKPRIKFIPRTEVLE